MRGRAARSGAGIPAPGDEKIVDSRAPVTVMMAEAAPRREDLLVRKWKCGQCGYIHTGDAPPETCPVCGAPKEKFVEYIPQR